MAHTPGPWEVAPCCDTDETRDIVAGYSEWQENGRTMKRANWIAELCADVDFDSDPEAEYQILEANAHLIAAAPDLLAALKLIASRAGGCQLQPHDALSGEPTPEYAAVNEIREWARAAISKAERA